jgi:hypothetical protein
MGSMSQANGKNLRFANRHSSDCREDVTKGVNIYFSYGQIKTQTAPYRYSAVIKVIFD